tara:strand:+ start:593 stop:1054 length:462 start_codon:yes stop_codon:yes gene_type:complete
METFNTPNDTKEIAEDNPLSGKEVISEKWLQDKLESIIPLIQERWPDIAQQTIEATKGSIDDLANIISSHTGKSPINIKDQLFEIINSIQSNNWEISDHIQPIEDQLEELLEELNKTLRPKIENPIRRKPILSIAIAAGIGLFIGSVITNRGR